jgi:hypothetical protein
MDLPFIVKPFNIFLLFLAEVAVLHIIFIAIPPFRLRKTGLAVVQYIVLLLALLGLVSAISNARQQVAQNLFNFSKPNVEFEFRSLRSRIDDYSAPGLTCMTFVRSPASPPAAEFDRTQHDYDEACQWFKQIASSVPRDLPPDNGPTLSKRFTRRTRYPFGISLLPERGRLWRFRKGMCGEEFNWLSRTGYT